MDSDQTLKHKIRHNLIKEMVYYMIPQGVARTIRELSEYALMVLIGRKLSEQLRVGKISLAYIFCTFVK